MTSRLRLWLVPALVLGLFMGALPVMPAFCAGAQVEFIAPISGEITERFDAPANPYGPGHRGIDFAADEGTPVFASNDGDVTFAGTVADAGLFITIDHGWVRTSYSYLSEVGVAAGDKVQQGTQIGLSGPGHVDKPPALHFGARVGEIYIDPEILLFGDLDDISDLIALAPIDGSVESAGPGRAGPGSAGLDPVDPPKFDTGERGPVVALGGGIAGFFGGVGTAVSAGAKWTGDRMQDLASATSSARDSVSGAIGGLVAGAKRAGSSVGGAVGNAVAGAWRGFSGWVSGAASSIADAASAVGSAFGRAGRWLGEKAKAAWQAVARAARAAKDSIAKAGRWLGSILGRIARTVAITARQFWRGVLVHLRLLVIELQGLLEGPRFIWGMANGIIDQISCSREGGAKPPNLPSVKEFRNGVEAPPPPNDNIVVAVAGLGSSSQEGEDGEVTSSASMYSMDLRTLGYDEDSIYHFSYKGIEEHAGGGPYRLHAAYSKEDTYQRIEDSAFELERLVEQIHQRYPDKEIDLVAHSQGGLVVEQFLSFIGKSTSRERPPISHFVSIASPHLGTDAATIDRSLRSTAQGRIWLNQLNGIANKFGLSPPSSPSVRQMAEDSPFVERLTESWDPSSVDTTTISATLDWVVPPQHTRLEGARHYTADIRGFGTGFGDHAAVVTAESTKGILYNALADTPSECTALRNAYADYGPGRWVERMEDRVAGTLEAASYHGQFGLIP